MDAPTEDAVGAQTEDPIDTLLDSISETTPLPPEVLMLSQPEAAMDHSTEGGMHSSTEYGMSPLTEALLQALQADALTEGLQPKASTEGNYATETQYASQLVLLHMVCFRVFQFCQEIE